jgi:hypothetical protein
MKKLLVVLALLFWGPVSQAQLSMPEDGVWWNPAEPGRGYFIESQNGLMVVATYIYDASGNPQWYLSSGSYNRLTRRFTATLDASRGGQCFGCPFRAPVVGASGGPITIQFASAVSGTLNAGGVSIPIQRFIYNYALPDGLVFGGWSMTQQTGSFVSGDWLVFNSTFLAPSGGPPYVAGNRDRDSASVALGRFEQSLGKWLFVLDSSSSFWRAYEFDMNKRSMAGRSWLYPKGSTLTGAGFPFFGARIQERYELTLSTVAAAGGAKRALQEARDTAEWSDAVSAAGIEKAADARMLSVFAELERAAGMVRSGAVARPE